VTCLTHCRQIALHQVINAPRREHSQKPDEAYELIERMYPGLPKIELFARNAREGWHAWGNQAPQADEYPDLPPALRRAVGEAGGNS
jgi:N6-adenosine-specific RNA methylase IME4